MSLASKFYYKAPANVLLVTEFEGVYKWREASLIPNVTLGGGGESDFTCAN